MCYGAIASCYGAIGPCHGARCSCYGTKRLLESWCSVGFGASLAGLTSHSTAGCSRNAAQYPKLAPSRASSQCDLPRAVGPAHLLQPRDKCTPQSPPLQHPGAINAKQPLRGQLPPLHGATWGSNASSYRLINELRAPKSDIGLLSVHLPLPRLLPTSSSRLIWSQEQSPSFSLHSRRAFPPPPSAGPRL